MLPQNHYFHHPNGAVFEGVVCLENNKVNQQVNVTMDTSSIRTTNS